MNDYNKKRVSKSSKNIHFIFDFWRFAHTFPFLGRKVLWEASHKTFRILKSDLDIRSVYHKTDDGIKAHLNLAVLAYWIVSVTKYWLKLKKYPNIRWSEIMRIALAQAVVTAEMETATGSGWGRAPRRKRNWLSYTACWTSTPIPSERSNPWYTQIHLQKIRLLKIREFHKIYLQCGLRVKWFFSTLKSSASKHITLRQCFIWNSYGSLS